MLLLSVMLQLREALQMPVCICMFLNVRTFCWSFGCGIIQHIMKLNFLMCADVYMATARL